MNVNIDDRNKNVAEEEAENIISDNHDMDKEPGGDEPSADGYEISVEEDGQKVSGESEIEETHDKPEDMKPVEESSGDGEKSSGFKKFTAVLLKAKQTGLYITSDEFLDNAIRIMLGLICLMISLIHFVPATAATILSVAAVVFCGADVARNALSDVIAGGYLSQNVIVLVAAVVSLIAGYPADSVFALLVAELGFKLRTDFIESIEERADKQLDSYKREKAADIIRQSLDTSTHEIRRLAGYKKLGAAAAIGISAVIAVVGFIAGGENGREWVHRGMVLAMVAVPACESIIMVLPYRFGILKLFEDGIGIRNSETLHSISSLTSVIFDKRGTITDEKYEIIDIDTVRLTREQLLYLAAYGEAYSDHPIAETIREAYGNEIDQNRIMRHVEEPGAGAFVQLTAGEIIAVGNLELMEKIKVRGNLVPSNNTVVYVAVDRTYVGRIELQCSIIPEAVETVSRLRRAGVANVALMTGDNTMAANNVGKAVGISEIYADCLPKDKYERVKYIMDSQDRDDKLAYVCSGQNRVEAMSLADVGVIVGAEEEHAGGAEVVIFDGGVSAIVDVVNTARQVQRKMLQNLSFVAGAAAITLILGLAGIVGMWFALTLNVAAVVAATLNSSVREKRKK